MIDRQFTIPLKYILAMVVALVLVIVFSYFFINKKDTVSIFEDATMYLTLRTNEPGYLPGLFSFNNKNKTLSLMLDDGRINITSNVSLSRNRMVYSSKEEDDVLFQLRILDLTNGTKSDITKSNTFYKRYPEWSPVEGDKRIAFTARKVSAGGGSTNPDDWYVYIINIDGNEELITRGTRPQWSPDGSKLLVTRSDGLHLYDLKLREEKKVIDVVYENTRIMITTIAVKRTGWFEAVA